MNNVFDMHDFVAAVQGDQQHMLGKFLYFSLANLLVDKGELSKLCEDMGIPYSGGTRLSVADAFRSATGDIRERVPVTAMGKTNIYLAYCRDNKRTSTEILSRELVKETLNQKTNNYEKLANISCDKKGGVFRVENMMQDDAIDVPACCRKAEELFELYQKCANRFMMGRHKLQISKRISVYQTAKKDVEKAGCKKQHNNRVEVLLEFCPAVVL